MTDLAKAIRVPHKIVHSIPSNDFGHFARILDIDLSRHLLKTIMLDMDNSYEFVSVTYKNLLDFCVICHFVGHHVAHFQSLRNKENLQTKWILGNNLKDDLI